jgi:hypothetical protein
MELIDSTGLTYIWCYVVPGDDGTREEGKTHSLQEEEEEIN